MTTDYASILARKYHSRVDTSFQGDVELAFCVVDVLGTNQVATEPWRMLLVRARGFIKVRARRSRSRFKMQFIKAIEYSDLHVMPPEELEAPEASEIVQPEPCREDIFRDRVRNPRLFRRGPFGEEAPVSVETSSKPTIIRVEIVDIKEREHEFARRIKSPRSFRRGN